MENVIDPKGKVADLHTSLKMQELGFNVETEKAWYKHVESPYPNYFVALQNHSISGMAIRKICPAPDFPEIFRELPKEFENPDGKSWLAFEETNFGYLLEDYFREIVLLEETFYFPIKNGNLAQAAAELWCKLKTEKII